MKRFLFSLLTLPASKCYCNLHESRNLCLSCEIQTTSLAYLHQSRKPRSLCLSYETQIHHQRKSSLKRIGRQVQLINELAYHLRSLLMSWTSLDVLTANLKLRLNFLLSLNRYWQGSFNISPIPFAPDGGFKPLTQLKAIGVIWMISNISMPVKRSGELLHIFGGV